MSRGLRDVGWLPRIGWLFDYGRLRDPARARDLRWRLEFAGAWCVLSAARLMAEPLVAPLCEFAGLAAYWLGRRTRRWTIMNLRLAFGDHMDEPARRRLGAAMMAHHIRTIIEMARATPRWIAKQVVPEGFENAAPMFAQGRGVIAVACHLGNNELLAPAMLTAGVRCTMLARPLDNPYLDRYLAACRERYGSRTTAKDVPGLRELLRRLRTNEGIGLTFDQNVIRDGVFTHFFGIPAATARGAAALALHSGAPVALLVTYRLPDGRHKVILHPPFQTIRTGDDERDIVANLEQYNRAAERYIAAHPEQYHWQHWRWRTRPDGKSMPEAAYSGLEAERKRPPAVPARPWRAAKGRK